MATLENKICKLCGVKTWEEDGFIQCDCIMVDKEDWAHGVAETPKEWIDMPPMADDGDSFAETELSNDELDDDYQLWSNL